jgi:peptide/nickel transport system substrate-binding protein
MQPEAQLAALRLGSIDVTQPLPPHTVGQLADALDVQLESAAATQSVVIRMRSDSAPWRDASVRQAFKLSLDRTTLLAELTGGAGVEAADTYTAPHHPAFTYPEPVAYDPERARALLAQAGYVDGLTAYLVTQPGRSEQVAAEAIQASVAAGGFDIRLGSIDPDEYRERWTEIPFGITVWSHRPLATMSPILAFSDVSPWNETGWHDDELSALLRQADQVIDVPARRERMRQIDAVVRERGPVAIPFHGSTLRATRRSVQNLQVGSGTPMLHLVWIDNQRAKVT